MNNSALALCLLALLPLAAACTSETAEEGEGRHDAVSSAVVTSGRGIPCHFTVAGCAGEGPDGFAQDPGDPGAGGGGGGYATMPVDPGGAQAYTRCANQCTSSSLYISQSNGSCDQACLSTGARSVRHFPGIGFLGDGSAPDPSNLPGCISQCGVQMSLCITACDGGVF